MKPITRIEQSLAVAIASGEAEGCPPKLAGAIRHAVFPGGARIRPQLCLAVAQACGDDDPTLSDAAATAIELLHCASLVHDDLPCFDDATTRRGRASVHFAFGESLAVLAGDALIVLAFQTLGAAASRSPLRLPALLGTIASSTGMPHGIVAGQAWECEPRVLLSDYQRAKTGSLFSAATIAGAQAAGADDLIDGSRGDVARQVSALTGGRGVESVIDVVAARETLEASVVALAPGGRLVIVGVRPPAVFGDSSKFTLDATMIVRKGIEVRGSRYVTATEIAQTLELLRQKRVRAIVDRTFPLEQAEQVHQMIRENRLVGRVALVVD